MDTKRELAVVLVLLAAPSSLHAQAQLEWSATRVGPVADQGAQIAFDNAGNVFLTNWSAVAVPPPTPATADVELCKYSPAGSLLWSRRFDSQTAPSDKPDGLVTLADGSVCIAGTATNGPNRGFIARYDSAGNLLWSDIFGGAGGFDVATARALALDAAGNLILAGSIAPIGAPSDMLVRCYAPAGQILWERTIDGPQNGWDGANCVLVDPAGSIFVGGQFDSSLAREGAIAKLDSAGQLLWQSDVPAGGAVGERFTTLESDGLGGVIAGGSSDFSNPSTHLAWIVRIGGAGSALWSKSAGVNLNNNFTTDLFLDERGTIWVACWIDQLGAGAALVQRYSVGGSLLSSTTFSGQNGIGAHPGTFARGSAGQVFLVASQGYSFAGPAQEAALLQFDLSGDLNWVRTFATPGLGMSILVGAAGPNARVAAAGLAFAGSQKLDALAVQFDVSDAPQGYCTAKVNSLGCTPSIGFTGTSSASSSSGFAVRVEQLANSKNGLFFYGVSGSAATPFGGGTLCVAPPVRRTPGQNSGGTAPPAADCTGVFSIDMNAFAQGALGGTPLPALSVAGTAVYVQSWGRDPGFAPPNNVTLSGGLRYVVLP
jgi:hypothetical protein